MEILGETARNADRDRWLLYKSPRLARRGPVLNRNELKVPSVCSTESTIGPQGGYFKIYFLPTRSFGSSPAARSIASVALLTAARTGSRFKRA